MTDSVEVETDVKARDGAGELAVESGMVSILSLVECNSFFFELPWLLCFSNLGDPRLSFFLLTHLSEGESASVVRRFLPLLGSDDGDRNLLPETSVPSDVGAANSSISC